MNRSYRIISSDTMTTADEADYDLNLKFYELLKQTHETHILQAQSPRLYYPGTTELGESGCIAVQAFMLHPFFPEKSHAAW